MTGNGGKRTLLLLICLLGTLLFSGLGVWQVERRAWKLDLIERVEARVHAAAVPVPPRAAWARLDPKEWEYRRVRAVGRFDMSRATLVDALTERGAGNWLVVPLVTPDGPILVNRGLVPKGWQPPQKAGDEARSTVTGLLRLTEPEGRFLRPNQPSANRWFSRDVSAIAATRGLEGAAPFFIDADGRPDAESYPVGGLTVIKFRNAHLVYALTWFGLAALCLAGLVLLLKPSQRRR